MSQLRARRRWLVAAVAAVVVAGGGTGAWALTRSTAATSTTTVATAKVTSVTQTVSASGTIEPAQQADLSFAVSGRVTSVKVKAGDTVTKGQTLATVGSAALKATEQAAKATVEADKATVAEDSSSSTQLTADRSALTAARSSLAAAKTAVTDAVLRATFAGTVTAVDLTKGEQVSAGSGGSSSPSAVSGASTSDTSSSTSSSDSQVSLQSTKTFVVDATVDDTEVSAVKKGQTVQVTPDGATTAVTGTVTSVSKVSSTTSGVVSFPIVVRLTGHPSGVYADASATLSIVTKHVAGVLEIPTLAITYNGSAASVKLKTTSGTTTQTVTVGSTYGQEAQILSGLKSGDQVVVTTPTFGGGRPGGTTRRTGTGTGGTNGTTGGFGQGAPTGSTSGLGGFGGSQ